MTDFLLAAAFIGLLIRGWMRGLVRELVGLAVIVGGIFLAFRLSAPAGAVVSAMTGTGADVSRFIGGIVVFLLISVAGGGRVLRRQQRHPLPARVAHDEQGCWRRVRRDHRAPRRYCRALRAGAHVTGRVMGRPARRVCDRKHSSPSRTVCRKRCSALSAATPS